MTEEQISNGSATGGAPPSRGTRAQRRYGRLLAEAQLKTLFNSIIDQPVPDDLLDLLRRIDARLLKA